MSLTVSTSRIGAVGLVSVDGVLDILAAERLKREFQALLDTHGIASAVLELGRMTMIDSAGLGALISCLRRCQALGGDVHVVGLQAQPRMIFEITRAHRVFRVYDDLEAAVADLPKLAA